MEENATHLPLPQQTNRVSGQDNCESTNSNENCSILSKSLNEQIKQIEVPFSKNNKQYENCAFKPPTRRNLADELDTIDAKVEENATHPPLPQQTNRVSGQDNCESTNSNENCSILSKSLNEQIKQIEVPFSKNNKQYENCTFKPPTRRNLADELDTIDAKFEQEDDHEEKLTAPDGIRITINRQEEDEFAMEGDEDLDYEDESIYPVEKNKNIKGDGKPDCFNDDETVFGDFPLDTSTSSSAIISFKTNGHNYAYVEDNTPKANKNVTVTEKSVAAMTPEELMEANPALRQLMEKLTGKDRKRNRSSERRLKEQPRDKRIVKGNSAGQGRKDCKSKGDNAKIDQVKSPSDTTIYAPALKLVSDRHNQYPGVVRQFLNDSANITHQNRATLAMCGDQLNEQQMNKISEFLDQVRVDVGGGGSPTVRRTSTVTHETQQALEPQPCTFRDPLFGEQIENANKAAQERFLQSECFKATTELPQGMVNNVNQVPHDMMGMGDAIGNTQTQIPNVSHPNVLNNVNLQNLQIPNLEVTVNPQDRTIQGITDDEFFHLTCHVDANLKQRIQRGEFVELEKWLVKDRFRGNSNTVGQRMELVNWGGETYIMPVENSNKITNVRKWEQAFRIYTAIYSQANPQRSSEIWQYVFVINSAASTYIWENVANYDFTFRQLMACNPLRSWANIYLQMWNLTMRDPIPRNQNFRETAGVKRDNKGKKNRKPSYCWSFNRGEKCKFEPNCHFVKRCSYCDATGHGQFECPKLKSKK